MSGKKGAQFPQRRCPVCGRWFLPACGRQKYCQYCRPIVRRFHNCDDPVFEAKRHLYAAERPQDFVIADGCKGCIYWRSLGGEYACHYMLDTYERRPCPPGAGCIVRRESVRHRVRTKRSNPAGYASVLARVKL